ncbi:MAG: hypothetical protein IT437_03730, partial [Phycisphaerales bacterium]|nr:hypothetical protein [Phycisphaerales bacterium]
MNTRVVVVAAGLAACAGAVSAQCQPQWDLSPGNPGNGLTFGYIAPIFPYNDGGGDRIFVGASDTPLLSKYDPATNSWSPLTIGTGFTNGFLTSFTVFNPGSGNRLIVAGFYDNANGVPNTASLAMWNGTAFEAMGTGWTGTTRQSVQGMAVWNGKLYVGGGIVNQPPTIAGQPWGGFAAWDGTTWTVPATTMTGFSPNIFKLRVFNDGAGEALFAAGRFANINGIAMNNVAKFDGANWSALGAGLPTSQTGDMESMAVFQGLLHVGGSPSGGSSVFKWDGAAWTAVGQGLGGRTTSLAVFDDGSGEALYAGGTAQGGTGNIAKLVGGAWVMLGGGVDASVFGTAAIGDRLYVGGSFLNANGQPANRIAAWTACPAVACYPDCNGDSVLNLSDFGCFTTKFALGDAYADCNGDGVLNLS